MKKLLLVMAAISAATIALAKGVAFNLMVANGCQLDEVVTKTQGATYKPAPPAYVKSNSSSSFMVDIDSDATQYFDIDYKINCPAKNRSGYLIITGDYIYWDYEYHITDNTTGIEFYSGSSGYYGAKSAVIINIK